MGSGNLETSRRRSSVKLAKAASAAAVWESHRLNEWLHALFDVF